MWWKWSQTEYRHKAISLWLAFLAPAGYGAIDQKPNRHQDYVWYFYQQDNSIAIPVADCCKNN